jgi:hypothetical protein
MPYTAAKNAVESWFRKKLLKPRIPDYMMGIDTSFGLDGTSVSVTATNGTLTSTDFTVSDLKITMESVLRAAESVPPRDRGNSLVMPIYNYTFTTGGSSVVNDPINIQTVNIPWQYVYQYEGAQQAKGGMLGSIGAQSAFGYQAASNNYYSQMAYGLGQYGGFGAEQTTMNNIINSVMTVNYPEQTPEEREAWIKAEKERTEKRVVAVKRAESLLFTILKPEQVRQYQDHGYFETEIDDRTYRIKKGRSGNVFLVKDGKEVARFCAHPELWTPDQDVMISQLLMLKTNEKRFLETANRTQLLRAA